MDALLKSAIVIALFVATIIDRGTQISRQRKGSRLNRCPLLCRCFKYRTRFGDIHSWSGYFDKTGRWNVLENRASSRQVRRGSALTSTLKMTCMGVTSMPPNIPAGITEISILGDSPTTKRRNLATVNDEVNYKWNRYAHFLNNQLTTINKEAFQKAKYIRKLTLSNNRIKILKPDDFKYLGNLHRLDLNTNGIKILSPKSFAGLGSLDQLRLSKNRIQELPIGLFKHTPRLRNVYIDNNEITTLPSKVFSALSQLNILDLSNNRLAHLQPDVFRYNGKMFELLLEGNDLRYTQQSWFRRLGYLRTLSLKNNSIEALGADSFKGLKSLRRLTLSTNKLSSIHRYAFRGLGKLQRLDLSDNSIARVNTGFLYELRELMELNLATNRIRVIGIDAFKYHKQLVSLDLSRNKITRLLNTDIRSLKSLRKLDASNNYIKKIASETFIGLTDLRELDLTNNEISMLERSCFSVARAKHLSKITWLSLDHNRLTSLDVGVLSGMPHLKFLSVSHNQLVGINLNAFYLLPNLRTLSLSSNKITSINGIFKRLKYLRHLNLAENRVRGLTTQSFHGVKSLQELDISSNSIELIDSRVFSNLTLLNRLNISNNRLKSFNTISLTPMKQLTFLDLSKNDIVIMNFGENAISLKFVSIAENRLTSIAADIMSSISPFGKIDLRSNPWSCDCRLSWLRRIKREQLISGDELVCKYPPRLSGLKILSGAVAFNNCHVPSRPSRGKEKNKPENNNTIYNKLTSPKSIQKSRYPAPTDTATIAKLTRVPRVREDVTTPYTDKIMTSFRNTYPYATKRKWRQNSYVSNQFSSARSTIRKKKTPQFNSSPASERLHRIRSTTPKPMSSSRRFTTDDPVIDYVTASRKAPGNQKALFVPQQTHFKCEKPINKNEAVNKRLERTLKKETKSYHVSITNKSRKFACNGILLNKKWVLTSAMCLRRNVMINRKMAKYILVSRVKIGERELNKVTSVVFHPLSSYGSVFDFALLQLKYDSLLMYVLQPLCAHDRGHVIRVGKIPVAMATRVVRYKNRGKLRGLSLNLDARQCGTSRDCLRIQGNLTAAVVDGAGLFVRSSNAWNLVGMGSRQSPNRFIPIWPVLSWINKTVYPISSS